MDTHIGLLAGAILPKNCNLNLKISYSTHLIGIVTYLHSFYVDIKMVKN